jgi:hypothetical protein
MKKKISLATLLTLAIFVVYWFLYLMRQCHLGISNQ